MKLLTKNVLRQSTVSSAAASANYPARNLIDDFLLLRYQANATQDSITFDLDEQQSFDSFYIGYTGNVTSITVTFFSEGEAQQIARSFIAATGDGNIRVFEPGVVKYWGEGPTDHWRDYTGLQYASRHFPTITGVDSVTVEVSGTSPIYVGGMAGGEAIDMPAATAAWRDDYEDNSTVSRSPHGQTQQNYISPYNVFQFSFDAVGFDKFYEVKEALRELGSGLGAWVTYFEDSESEFPPGYATITMRNPQRERNTYSFGLTFTEAR